MEKQVETKDTTNINIKSKSKNILFLFCFKAKSSVQSDKIILLLGS